MPLRIFLAVLLTTLTSTAHAHGVRTDVLITLDAPLQTPGVTAQLHQGAIAPQLVLENRSGKLLEIDDARGHAFLRIGPASVEADVNSAAWRDSLNPVSSGGAPKESAARWRTIRNHPSYGWFDPRIDPQTLQIPKEIEALAVEAPIGRWQITARLGDTPVLIEGRFLYQPPPQGTVETALRAPLPAGLIVELAQGRVPALFVHNTGPDIVRVLDGRNRVLHVLQPGQRQTWLEPRAAYSDPIPKNRQPAQRLGEWQIPIQIGEQRSWIRGTHTWQPVGTP